MSAPITDCSKNCDYSKAVLKSRATWCCAKCGRDFSVEYLFWYEATHPDWEKMTRYALRTDHNQKPIVEALRAAGAKVKVVHQPYDLQVWAYPESDRCMYMEIKNPKTAYGKKGLNSKQEAESRGLPVVMADSIEAALRALNVLRNAQNLDTSPEHVQKIKKSI